MHCNLRPPNATPDLMCFNFIARAKFVLPQPIRCRLRPFLLLIRYVHYAVTMNFDPVTLTFDLWPWTYVVDWLHHGRTLYEIWAKSDNPRRSYCSLNIWPYELEHVSRMLWDSLYKVNTQPSYEFMKCNDFLMLIRHITLRPWPLTRNLESL